jgi:hypothetical protein
MSERDYYNTPLSEEEKEFLNRNYSLVQKGSLPDRKEYYDEEKYRDIYRYCFDRLERLKENTEKDYRKPGTYREYVESKRASKLKIFGISLLGYAILNISYSIVYLLITFVCVLIAQNLGFVVSPEIVEGFSVMAGGYVAFWVGDKLIKNEEDERRVIFMVGIIAIVNNLYFIKDVFVYGDPFSFRYVLFLFVGISCILYSKSPRNNRANN